MRYLCLALALPLLAGGAAAQQLPSIPDPDPDAVIQQDAAPSAQQRAQCRDRIEMVRHDRGLPRLRRENAGPDEAGFEALMFHAVDRDVAGCDVLVMVGDRNDIRPLPEPRKGPLLRRIASQ